MRSRVKICGITTPEDGLLAVKYGADAIGLVFYPHSPRAVDAEKAYLICQVIPAFVSVVGLFVNEEQQQVERILNQVPIDLLQFHGSETPAYCAQFGPRYIKAISMKPNVDLEQEKLRYQGASGLLLDTYSEDLKGGSGAVFDWNRVPDTLDCPIILAGGLNADNVADAIRRVRPYAVDVSSGVEHEKGKKDEVKIRRFMKEVSNAKIHRSNQN